MTDFYDYREAVKNSVIDWLEEHKEEVEARHSQMGEDEFAEWVIDECMMSDSVTGNASGSYTFSTWKAEECLCHNLDLLVEVVEDYGGGAEYVGQAIMKGAETCDVTIRCYVLYEVVGQAIDEFFEED